jgi:ParB/RepB/Spo0J family partition protein
MTTATEEKTFARNGANYFGYFEELPPESIYPSEFNPRKMFDEAAMRELSESLKMHGMIEPIVVRTIEVNGSGRLEIICGERRWRAAKLAELKRIPVRRLIGIDDRTALEMALTENLARKDINPIEEAEGYRALRDMAGLRVTDIAQRVNRDPSTISNSIRLVEKLPEEIQDKIRSGELSASHGKALIPYAEYPKLLEYKLNQAENGVPTKEVEKFGYSWQLANMGIIKMLETEDIGVEAAKECLHCHHRRKSDGRDGWICLKTECAQQKKADRKVILIAEQKKAANLPEDSKLPSLNDLAIGSYERLDLCIPSGCRDDCEHRINALDYQNRICHICIDSICYQKLKAADSRVKGKERKQSHQEMLDTAIAFLDSAELTPATVLLACWDTVRDPYKKAFRAALDHRGITIPEEEFRSEYRHNRMLVPKCWDKLVALGPEAIIRLAAEIAVRQEIFSNQRDGFDVETNEKTAWLLEHAEAMVDPILERTITIAPPCDISDVTSIPEELNAEPPSGNSGEDNPTPRMYAGGSDRYRFCNPNIGGYRYYQICEASDGDGWMICWHGSKEEEHHRIKKLGHFDSIEDAQPALDALAIKMGMDFWEDYPEPTRSGITGEWITARYEEDLEPGCIHRCSIT